MPHTLRSVDLEDETLAELWVLCGFDDDLAGQITATSNRIRGLLTQIHPAVVDLLTRRRGHFTTANERKVDAVFTRSLPWLGVFLMFSSSFFAAKTSTKIQHRRAYSQLLNQNHRALRQKIGKTRSRKSTYLDDISSTLKLMTFIFENRKNLHPVLYRLETSTLFS